MIIEQVRTGSEVRRMAVLKRPLGNSVVLVGALVLVAIVVVTAGRGGGEDGALGALIALVVLIGGAVLIQRLSRARILLGFNPEGLWSPPSGWLEWGQVQRIEVRQTSSRITGRHHTVWVRYERAEDPSSPSADEAWLDVSPGYRQWRTLATVEEMERCWRAATPPPTAPPVPSPEEPS